tara:strand:+ start:304 stop:480 length:177 start_codon:yes stop_codon:yes gene_type:complete
MRLWDMEKITNEERLNAIVVELQSLFIEFENLYKGSIEKMDRMTEEIDEELSSQEENK